MIKKFSLVTSSTFLIGCAGLACHATPVEHYNPLPPDNVMPEILYFADYPEAKKFEPLNLSAPAYPRGAWARLVEGAMVIVYSIDKKGEPFNIHILYTGADENMIASFQSYAVRHVMNLRFTPSIFEGNPVVTHNVTWAYRWCLGQYGDDRQDINHRERACESDEDYQRVKDSIKTPRTGFSLN